MKSVEYDLRYFEAGLESLEEYLLTDDMFYPLAVKPPDGEPDYPRLTLGWLLLTGARLKGRDVDAVQKVRLEKAFTDFDRNRAKWRVAWEKKARHCFQTRARMWGNYLDEYRENPHDNADRYPYEVRLRVMLELLGGEFSQQQAEADMLRGSDGFLRAALVMNGFIWEKEIQEGFPQDKYWYLYGKLTASGGRG